MNEESRHALVMEDAPRMRKQHPHLAVFAPALCLELPVEDFVRSVLRAAAHAEFPSDDGAVVYVIAGQDLVRITMERVR